MTDPARVPPPGHTAPPPPPPASRVGKKSPLGGSFRERLELGRPVPRPRPVPPLGETSPALARPVRPARAEPAPTVGLEPARRAETPEPRTPSPEPLELAPFRIGPAILSPPIARAALEPPTLDPALFSAELVESMRVGRFGRDGHAMTMRLRGARGAIDVDVRTEGGRLALRLRGDDDEELERIRARVGADLAERGIELDEG
jgi:hypothetical protein